MNSTVGFDHFLYLLDRERPKTILDVGAGSGSFAKAGNTEDDEAFWTALEVWEPYVSEHKLHRWYDNVIVADTVEADLPEVDLTIFGDVLRFLPQKDAMALVDEALEKSNHVLVHTIANAHPAPAQGSNTDGNPYLVHKHDWDHVDFLRRFSARLQTLGTGVDMSYKAIIAWYHLR